MKQQDDSEKIVEEAISRMMSGAIVKEEKRSTRIWVVVVGVLLAIGIFAISYDFRYQTPKIVETDVNTVVLSQDKNGHYYAKGKINGHSVNFVVDTGATSVAIPEAMANVLGLAKGNVITTTTANGTAVGSSTILGKVELGSIERYSVDAVILPNMQTNEILLGMSFLKKLKIVQDKSQLTISQQR